MTAAVSRPISQHPRVYPHWFCQQQEWVADPVHSGSPTYNLPFHLRIRGPLDFSRAKNTIAEIIGRQEMLRSTFSISAGELLWWTSDPVQPEIPKTDLRHLPEEKALLRANEIAVEETLKPFNFSSGLLLRSHLIQIQNQDYILLLVSNHLVFDDWSVGVFYKEFTRLYRGFTESTGPMIPEISFQYSQFLDLQSRQLKGPGLTRRISFWRKQLEGAGDFHHLAKEKSRTAPLGTHHGAWASICLPPEIAARIREFGQQNGLTLFMVLLAAFQILLHRYSGDSDIGVGTCAANRSRLEIEGLIGRFGNDLVLRTDFADNPTVRELLMRVRRTCLEGFTYQDLPFSKLVEELGASRDPNRNPMFQVMFILRDAEKSELEIPGLEIERVSPPLETTKYDLSVWLDMAHGIEVGFEYSTQLFAAQEIQFLQKSFCAILEAMVSDGDAHVGSISMQLTSGDEDPFGSHSTKTEYAAPRTPAERELCEMWRGLLKVDSVGIRDNFFELGGGSLIAAQLCRRIERTFRKTVSLASVFEGPTVEQLAQLVSCETASDRYVKIVPLQPKGSNPPFFCVCMFVGSGPIFLPLTKYLGDGQPFLGLVPENTLMNDLPQPYALTDIAQHIVRAIRAYQPCGPYFMGGFCGDGVVAFEAARLLRDGGEEVALLALFEAQTRDMQKEFQGKKTQLCSIGQRFSPRQIRRHLTNLLRCGMKGAPDYLLRRLRDLNLDLTDIWWQASIDWNLKMHGKLNDIKQVLFVAESAYTPQSYSGDVVLFRCRDYRVRPDEDRCGGWQQAVTGSIQLCEINGDHLGILNEPNVKTLALMLCQCLEEARPNAAPALLSVRPTSTRNEDDLSSCETVSSG